MIPKGPDTVTVVVTSGIFVPLAWMVVVPNPTDVTGIRIPGDVLPSQMKLEVPCTVATDELLEVMFTVKPAIGAVALSLSCSRTWFPIPAMVVFWLIHVMVEFTATGSGADDVKPCATALIVTFPTFTPANCGCVTGVIDPAGMVTVDGDTLTLVGSLLVRSTLSPLPVAGVDKVTVRVPVWLNPIVAGPDRLTDPGGATVTVAVASGTFGPLT